MTRRFASVWLPHWPAERWRRAREDRSEAPLALVSAGQGGVRLYALDGVAKAEGLCPGMALADARALVPALKVADADPAADAKGLARLSEWCTHYTPLVAIDGLDGLMLDPTGCAHLFGGEETLYDDLVRRLARFPLTVCAAVASTPAAAWAWARFGDGGVLVPSKTRDALAALPVAALRLSVKTIERLRQLGLRKIEDLLALPRAPLALRLGPAVLDRFDKLLGRAPDPLSPCRAPAERRVRMAFAEPIGRAEDITDATHRLIEGLCRMLAKENLGVRRLDLAFYRVDGAVQRLTVGTSRASRDASHLRRLFAERLGEADAGFGIEAMALEAAETEPLAASQIGLEGGEGNSGVALADLIDRLRARLGPRAVVQIVPVASHVPERAVTVVPAAAGSAFSDGDWLADQPRPISLLIAPEPIEAVAPIPDDPPVLFTWRRRTHRVRAASGPERISPEWWREEQKNARFRDYYRVEDEAGRRFWVFRDGPFGAGTPPRWYLHGLFS